MARRPPCVPPGIWPERRGRAAVWREVRHSRMPELDRHAGVRE
ncbi:hypothetical protein [Novacetimonas hansenii]